MSENVYILADSEICRRIGKKIRNLRLRQNITQMSLAEQSQETGEVRSGQVEAPIIEFLGWEGTYAKFKVKRGQLPNGRNLARIIVAHEGNWTTADGMFCYSEYDSYEDVQKQLGAGLTFIAKEYSNVLRRTLISYSLGYETEAILAVPATGEEIYFEIYGSDNYHGLCLLVEREL